LSEQELAREAIWQREAQRGATAGGDSLVRSFAIRVLPASAYDSLAEMKPRRAPWSSPSRAPMPLVRAPANDSREERPSHTVLVTCRRPAVG
jgi:hypothetical protein